MSAHKNPLSNAFVATVAVIDSHQATSRALVDFQLVLARIVRRARAGKDITGILAQAEDMLRRKGSLSPLRDAALNPAPAKPDGDA